MKNLVCLLAFLLIPFISNAQTDFLNDNKLYNNLYPHDLVEFLKANPDALLIDVRSPGEFADTSSKQSLNIGHLKGAINISIDSIENRVNDIKDHTDKPVILYCSHSQRSRRVSKYLLENGFKKVYNLNGGMTYMTQANENDFPGKKEMIVFSQPYRNVSVEEAVNLINDNSDIVIIDVRTSAQFEGQDSVQSNNIGRIKHSVNIPFEELRNSLSNLESYKDKNILVYDINGALGNPAAKILVENGFSKVNHLIGGTGAIYRESGSEVRRKIMTNLPKYSILNPVETVNLIKSHHDLIILDVRPTDDYNNKGMMSMLNVGRLKNSINFPAEKFESDGLKTLKDKNLKILLYGSGDGAYKCAKILEENGFKNVNVLIEGLWSLVSTYANIKGYEDIKNLIENHKGMW